MSIATIKTQGTGQSEVEASAGAIDVLFTFPKADDESTVLGEVHGFFDSLTDSTLGRFTGLISVPKLGEHGAVPEISGGFHGFLNTTLEFQEGTLVLEWLTEAGALDEDLVTVEVSEARWEFSDEITELASFEARAAAAHDAEAKANDYAEAIGGNEVRYLEVVERQSHAHTLPNRDDDRNAIDSMLSTAQPKSLNFQLTHPKRRIFTVAADFAFTTLV